MASAKELAAVSSSGNNTVVGPSILISGKLTGDEDLTVRGRVEGELTLSRTLIVEPSGIVKANVAVKNAIISGVVVGNINATESVELTKEGRMVGDIRAPRVIIVDGASFRGRVDMGDVEPGRLPAGGRPTIRPTVRGGAKPLPPPPPSKGAKGKPVPPPPPAKGEGKGKGESSKPPPLPPTPPVIGAGAKKKVVVKKKGR